MKVNALKVLKISAACCIAIFLANLLGLKSSTSAGIITLLSIQDTKKATFQIAGKRLLAFVPAVLFSLLIFWTVGFHVFSFGIFLFIFILFCYFAKLHELSLIHIFFEIIPSQEGVEATENLVEALVGPLKCLLEREGLLIGRPEVSFIRLDKSKLRRTSHPNN